MVLTCKHDFEEQLLLLRRFLVNVGVVALTSLIPESRQCQRSCELLKNIYYSLPCGSSEREVESFVGWAVLGKWALNSLSHSFSGAGGPPEHFEPN